MEHAWGVGFHRRIGRRNHSWKRWIQWIQEFLVEWFWGLFFEFPNFLHQVSIQKFSHLDSSNPNFLSNIFQGKICSQNYLSKIQLFPMEKSRREYRWFLLPEKAGQMGMYPMCIFQTLSFLKYSLKSRINFPNFWSLQGVNRHLTCSIALSDKYFWENFSILSSAAKLIQDSKSHL